MYANTCKRCGVIMSKITQSMLKELFEYNQSTGVFIRKVSTSNRVKVGEIAGTLTNHGYLKVYLNGKQHYLHRLAWLYVYGEDPEQIDHINHNRSDNRISNLRDVTNAENHKNMSIYKKNKSGKHGVTWSKDRQKWVVNINVDGKRISLGRYKNLTEAISVRERAEKEFGIFHEEHGSIEQKCLNIPASGGSCN